LLALPILFVCTSAAKGADEQTSNRADDHVACIRQVGPKVELVDVFVDNGSIRQRRIGVIDDDIGQRYEVSTYSSFVAVESYGTLKGAKSSIRIYHMFLGQWQYVGAVDGLGNPQFGWTGPGSLTIELIDAATKPLAKLPGVNVTFMPSDGAYHKSLFQSPEETASYRWFWQISEKSGATHAWSGANGTLPSRMEYGLAEYSPDRIGRNYNACCSRDGSVGAMVATFRSKRGIVFYDHGHLVHFKQWPTSKGLPGLVVIPSCVAIMESMSGHASLRYRFFSFPSLKDLGEIACKTLG
jgi:hypothetical protein